jgi:4-hydroxybenzoate polyprenyltransferase
MKRPGEQLLAFFSLIRVQNVVALLTGQVLVAKKVFCPRCAWTRLLWNEKFWLMLVATALIITAGYIIDSFYNYKRDLINRPAKTLREQRLRLSHKLYLYFALNTAAVALALWISPRAAVFFALYALLIWIYFHKLQFRPWWHELFPPFLILYPFFGLMLFFKQWNAFVLAAGLLVYLTLVFKELIKDYLTLKGDMVQGVRTWALGYHEQAVERLAGLLFLVWSLAAWWVAHTVPRRRWHFFILLLWIWMIFILFLFRRRQYRMAYMLIRLLTATGIAGVLLI